MLKSPAWHGCNAILQPAAGAQAPPPVANYLICQRVNPRLVQTLCNPLAPPFDGRTLCAPDEHPAGARIPHIVGGYARRHKYYGARSNEFGYVNHEIAPRIRVLSPLDTLR
jgi:hypothetical protein